MESELTEIFEWITRCLVVTVNTINICIVVHHTITPSPITLQLRTRKNGICQLCQSTPTTWWMATYHPFSLLLFIHLKISPTVMRREMVSDYSGCIQQRKVNSGDWRGQIIIASQSSQSHPSRCPGHLTLHFLCLPIIYIRLRLRHIKYLSISPPHQGSFEAKTGYRRLVVK